MSRNLAEYSRLKSSTALKKTHGSALVIAIFIIIVMSLLGSALIKMLSSTAESVAFEVIGTRAFQTAQIGLQWSLRDRFPLNSAALTCDGALVTLTNDGDTSSATLVPPSTINQAPGLKNCTISAVSCDDFKHDGVTYFTIKSTGQCDVGSEITSRTIEVTARSID